MRRFALASLALLLPLAACDSSGVDGPDDGRTPSGLESICVIIQDRASLNTLESVIDAELLQLLEGEGPYTVFAPDNAAFAGVQADLLAGLTANDIAARAQLAELLRYHVVEGEFRADDLRDGDTIRTLSGDELTVTRSGSDVFVDGVRISEPDVVGSNGVLHVLSGVVLTPIDVVDAAGLLGLDALVAGAQRADLAFELSTGSPLTVFAPTDAAFAAAGADALTDGQLRNILLTHVTPDFRTAASFNEGDVVGTLYGDESLVIKVEEDGVILVETVDNGAVISDATIVTRDIVVGNGVIHVIDDVLIPSAF